MWDYLKEWWNQPYWGTDFQKYQFARFKSKMTFLLSGLIFLLFLISIAELDARFHIIEFLGIPCESIYNEEKCIIRDEPWTKPLF